MNNDQEKLEQALEEKLNRLAQAISPGKSMVDEVMGKIDRLPAGAGMARSPAGGSKTRTWRTFMNSRFIKYGVAAVALIGIIGLLIWLTSGKSAATVAFADVIKQVREAQSVTFRLTVSEKDGKSNVIDYMLMEPGHIRFSWGDGLIWIGDFSKGRLIVLDPTKKTGKTLSAGLTADQIEALREVQLPNVIIEKLKTLPAGSEKSLGVKKVDGRSAVGFLAQKDGKNIRIWVDPDTNLPIRIEVEEIGSNGASAVYTDIKFNTKLDESLFSTTLPEGYTEGPIVSPITPEGTPLARGRQYAMRAIAARNMDRLAKACIQYSKDHNGEWPNSLEELLGKYGITEKDLVNPSQKQRKIGYVYLKPTGKSVSEDQLLIYEMYDEWQDGIGINVVFAANGHVKLIGDENEFKRLLEKTTAR